MEATTTRGSIRTAAPALRTLVLAVLRVLGAALITLAAVLAGTGVLYLIRRWTPLHFGPRVPGALPLQQLAGGERQPLGRMIVAWVPAGFVAGFAVASITRWRASLRVTVLAGIAALILLLAGAGADAIAITDPLGPHLLPQLQRVGTWVAVALFAVGVAVAEIPRTEKG